MGKRWDDWSERALPKRRWWATTCGVLALAGLVANLYSLPSKFENWGLGLGITSFIVYSIPCAFLGWLAILAFRRARRLGWGPKEPVSAAEPPQQN